MKKFILVLVVALASASAQASNPLSDFCRAVVAEGSEDAVAKKYPQEALICAYQRDKGLEELGAVNNQTCEHMAARVKQEFVGKKVQFTADSAEEVVYSRCVAMGSVANRGGIAIEMSEAPKPASAREVVDKEALKARVLARIAALKQEKKSLNALGNKSRDKAIDTEISRYKGWVDKGLPMDELGRALYDALQKQVTPPPPPAKEWCVGWLCFSEGFVSGAVSTALVLLLL